MRLRNRTVDTLLGRMLLHDIRLLRPRSREESVRDYRQSRHLQGMSRYFCQSEQVPGDHRQIFITVFGESIHYKTGRLFPFEVLLHQYDCEADQPVEGKRWVPVLDPERGPVLIPAGAGRKVRQGRESS